MYNGHTAEYNEYAHTVNRPNHAGVHEVLDLTNWPLSQYWIAKHISKVQLGAIWGSLHECLYTTEEASTLRYLHYLDSVHSNALASY